MHLLNSDWFSDPTKNDSLEIASLADRLKLFFTQPMKTLDELFGLAWCSILCSSI